MFCEKCGAMIPNGSTLCERCGFDTGRTGANVSPLLRRTMMFIEDGDWARADAYCERVLDNEPENAQAYVLKLMIRMQVKREEALGNAEVSYGHWNSYRKACLYADDAMRSRLESYLRSTEEGIRKREEERWREERDRQLHNIYLEACLFQSQTTSLASQREAHRLFVDIWNYRDSAERARTCQRTLEQLEEEERIRILKKKRVAQRRRRTGRIIVASLILVAILSGLIVHWINKSNEEKMAQDAERAKRAEQIEWNLVGCSFYGGYSKYTGSTGSQDETREQWEYTVTYTFLSNGDIRIDTTEKYDCWPFQMNGDERMWDSVVNNSHEVPGGDVEITPSGEITVIIDGTKFKLSVGSDDVATAIEIDGVTYYRK